MDSFFEEKIIIWFVVVETDPRPRYPLLDIPVWKGFAYFLKFSYQPSPGDGPFSKLSYP
jgi:hypothetical protein